MKYSKVQSNEMRQVLLSSREEHEKLWSETERLLAEHGDHGKDPGAVSKAVSWIKTESMMAMKPGDNTAANLMTDGCGMGIKTLNRCLNDYRHAMIGRESDAQTDWNGRRTGGQSTKISLGTLINSRYMERELIFSSL
jgi:hypothetical protein